MFKRPYFIDIFKRLKEPRRFIQILSGARQTGKTTIIQQIIADIDIPSIYVSADAITVGSGIWIEQQWETARIKLKKEKNIKEVLLVIDEIQKIPRWSEVVKRQWDADSIKNVNIKVVLLGSAPLLIQKGLTETLAGRFELVRIPHWTYPEMKSAFGFSIEQYIYYGGYPGSAVLIEDEHRWKQYVRDALIETTISKDILMMTRIDKPALLKRLFELGCLYSGQILSFNKILGQLQDAGNTTTLSHYLELLDSAGILAGLQKYSSRKITQRSSSPKFQVLNNALMSSQINIDFEEVRLDPAKWGRLVESAVGAFLINITKGTDVRVFYWRDRNREVDFVLTRGDDIVAIEVKSGLSKDTLTGLELFSNRFQPQKILLVGREGMDIEDFLSLSLNDITGIS